MQTKSEAKSLQWWNLQRFPESHMRVSAENYSSHMRLELDPGNDMDFRYVVKCSEH